MAPKRNVVFVLVPGSFSEPVVYSKVTEKLHSEGFRVAPTPLLSAGDRSPQPPATMYDDAQHIHDTIAKLLDDGWDVVLAMNSYGGIPGSQSVKGLSRAERGNEKPAVIALVYIASFLLPEGTSSNDKMSEVAPVGPEGDIEQNPYMHLDANVLPPLVFSDLPESEQQHYFSIMTTQSAVSFTNKLTYAGWKSIPATFILPDADKIVPPAMQHDMVDSANAVLEQGKKVKKVVFKASGHVPMLSRPEEVFKVLLEAAAEAA